MKSMMEQSYSALGVSCADVNQLCDTSVTGSDCVPYTTPYSTAACSDSSASSGNVLIYKAMRKRRADLDRALCVVSS